MRKLTKSSFVPDVLLQKGPAEVVNLTQEVASGNVDLSFKPGIYNGTGVKTQLLADQHGKCAFCESKRGRDFGAVEHYRPKGGWNAQPGEPVTKPGYYWLAYSWDNLLFCCSVCNTIYKKNLFPLADESGRDIEHQDISREMPLILNPYQDDPKDYLVFRHNHILARNTTPEVYLRAQKTIKCLGLDSDELNDMRLVVWQQYVDYTLALKIADRLGDNTSIQHFTRCVAKMKSEDNPFSGMLCNQIE